MKFDAYKYLDRTKPRLPLATDPMQEHNGVPGFFVQKDATAYQNLARRIINGRIAEIGNLFGLSISYIFDICKENNTQIFAIDAAYNPKFEQHLKSWNNENTVIPITLSSVHASGLFPEGFFDLVFIDANHKYDFVRQDIEHWLPKIKVKSGILAGHDYNSQYPGVGRAANELLGKKNIQFMGSSIWAYSPAGQKIGIDPIKMI